MIDSIQEYYLALLQFQMAILGFVIAGIVALMQMVTNAKPQRHIRLVIRYRVLLTYIFSLAVLLVAIGFGCWVVTFPGAASAYFGAWVLTVFAGSTVPLIFLTLCVIDIFIFAYLTFRARTVLDSRQYLLKYAKTIRPPRMRKYLEDIYGQPVDTPVKRLRRAAKQQPPLQYARDPFQPVREYIKDNAFKSYDYGTATGLRIFGELFDTTLAATARNPKPNEYYYLARYISESTLEFFLIFQKTASEKRKMDILRMVYEKGERLIDQADSEGLLTIIRGLEDIAMIAGDDDEIIAAVSYIQAFTDQYLQRHKKAKWAEISQTFEEICLAVTRLSEQYYLQGDDPLKTVPIIGHYTGEHRTVTAALVDFFTSYKDLADRYPDAYPQYYFEAVEAVNEALFARLGDIVADGRGYRGLNRTYHDLAFLLYSLYGTFGEDAVEHKKLPLLALCIANLRRVLKPAKNFGLVDERTAITEFIVTLAIHGVLVFGDIAMKGERTISMYALETLEKHGRREDIMRALDRVEAGGTDLKDAAVKSLVKDLRSIDKSKLF
jgi:hypothetical protein